ncbi:MAG: SDR family oxidoreductase [Hyphomicrobiaceae bacterium]|nr:SDR family oxidoreductase [Hyphomicrobiaceae bacterium]
MGGGKTAIVLGGYGLIGAACVRALRQDGFHVVGAGRSMMAAKRAVPDLEWRILDLATASIDELKQAAAGCDVVVNAAGALQDGLRDDVVAIHETMMARLVAALDGTSTRVIQISAAGVRAESSTEFFRSKARGDALLMASRLHWVVLRPTLVLAREAYGGTALLRASAAMPFTRLDMMGRSRIQTVFIDDVSAAVVAAARGDVAAGTVADLTEADSRSFTQLVAAVRGWLGFPAWRRVIRIPSVLTSTAARIGDALGYLGWRSALRSTALTVLSEGIQGDPSSWAAAGGARCRSLEETLGAMPATAQERIFARAYLLVPVIVGTLALFWLASGIIGLIRFDAAAEVLTARGFDKGIAGAWVVAGSIADIALGAGILWRRIAKRAAAGMIVVSLGYLAGATLYAPDLWADPLGPMLKVLPGLALALTAAALLDER